MSTPIITRAEFQQLAVARLEEAKALLDVGKWDGAYYLAGYAVELALKACIIKLDAWPSDPDYSKRCYTHNVGQLLDLAGLKPAWNAAVAADPILDGNWGIAKQWSEQKRYHRITEAEAKELYAAITDASHGVLPWIKTQW